MYSIAPSPLRAGVIWAGTDDGSGLADARRRRALAQRDAAGAHRRGAKSERSRRRISIRTPRTPRSTGIGSKITHAYIYRTGDDGATWTRDRDGNSRRLVRQRRSRRSAAPRPALRRNRKRRLRLVRRRRALAVAAAKPSGHVGARHRRARRRRRDRHARPRVLGARRRRAAAPASPAALAAGGDYLFAPDAAYRLRPGNDESTPLPRDEAVRRQIRRDRRDPRLLSGVAGAHAGRRRNRGRRTAACCGAGRAPTNRRPSIAKKITVVPSWIRARTAAFGGRRRAPVRVGFPREGRARAARAARDVHRPPYR